MVFPDDLGYRPDMANTFTSLHYHVNFSAKNREPRIHQDIEQRVWSYLGGIARENDMKALLVGTTRFSTNTKSTTTKSMCSVEAKSREGNPAAERYLTVAMGFSPRTGASAVPRRGATAEIPCHPTTNRSRVTTRRPSFPGPTRGLKPTAIITSSLCDELRLQP